MNKERHCCCERVVVVDDVDGVVNAFCCPVLWLSREAYLSLACRWRHGHLTAIWFAAMGFAFHPRKGDCCSVLLDADSVVELRPSMSDLGLLADALGWKYLW